MTQPAMTQPRFDLISIGRSSLDLYSNDSGAPFEQITNFASFVGGCPTNIAVGTRRLGMKSLLLTAVGDDPVGDFVVNFLRGEKIDTSIIPRKSGFRTSAVVLGIEPPDKFPLVFYRENCADLQLDIDDVLAAPIKESKAIVITGTGLSEEPSRTATIFAIEQAHTHDVRVILDLDFRPDQWIGSQGKDVRAYGVNIRALLHRATLVLGTEEEVKAAVLEDKSSLRVSHSQVSAPEVQGDLDLAIAAILACGPKAVVVKRGASGATVHVGGGEVFTAEPFKVEVCNVLGAGDAFASGFLYGYLKGWGWKECLRMGNATGAIVVTRQGCANFMPYEQEAIDFIRNNSDSENEGVLLNVRTSCAMD